MRRLTLALIGQPNVGKSTLFNVLTHGRSLVTNWPGTTVERHEAKLSHGGYELVLVDLPGVYGLTGVTLEERIGRDFILRGRPDVVVVLVDSLALERSLYLALEVLELTGRVVVGVTKVDEAHIRGIHVNYEALSRTLGVPVVPVSAVKRMGLSELLDAAVRVAFGSEGPPIRIDYGELEPFLRALSSAIRNVSERLGYPDRWAALKLLENDPTLVEEIRKVEEEVWAGVEEVVKEASRRLGPDLSALIARKRFEYAERIARSAVARLELRVPGPVRVSRVFYSPYLSPLVSLAILVGVLFTAFTVNTGHPLATLLERLGARDAASWLERHSIVSLAESLLERLAEVARAGLGGSFLGRLVTEALLGGVFALLLFVPLLLVALSLLGALEDSGLLTRMALGFHAVARRLGLSGHALFPLSLCFGCNVPGVLAARAVPSLEERLRLMLVLPFVPCQARLVVIVAIAGAVGGVAGGLLVPLAYLVAVSVALGVSAVLYAYSGRRRASEPEMLLELPPLHRPLPRVVWWFTWFNLKHFLAKAGSVIVLGSLAVWLLTNVGPDLRPVESVNSSVAARLSECLAPLLRPLGVVGEGSWTVALALLAGFVAKELFIATLLVATGSTSVGEALGALGLGLPSLAAVTLFVTLYVPCLATMASVRAESRSRALTALSGLVSLAIGYIVSSLAYLAISAFA